MAHLLQLCSAASFEFENEVLNSSNSAQDYPKNTRDFRFGVDRHLFAQGS